MRPQCAYYTSRDVPNAAENAHAISLLSIVSDILRLSTCGNLRSERRHLSVQTAKNDVKKSATSRRVDGRTDAECKVPKKLIVSEDLPDSTKSSTNGGDCRTRELTSFSVYINSLNVPVLPQLYSKYLDGPFRSLFVDPNSVTFRRAVTALPKPWPLLCMPQIMKYRALPLSDSSCTPSLHSCVPYDEGYLGKSKVCTQPACNLQLAIPLFRLTVAKDSRADTV